jgi:hypothetical protein
MKTFIRFGVPTAIVALYFVANHTNLGMVNLLIRIFATIALFQVVVSYFLWRAKNVWMQSMIKQGAVSDEYDSKTFRSAAVKGGGYALGILVLLYLPFYIALGWVWILSYLMAWFAIEEFLKSYLKERESNKNLMVETQKILNQ